jgi:hypothetical protein
MEHFIDDINNDKTPDIIVGSASSHKISIYLNIGNGTFTNQTISSMTFFPTMAKAVDINGDGKMKMIIIGVRVDNSFIGTLSTYC